MDTHLVFTHDLNGYIKEDDYGRIVSSRDPLSVSDIPGDAFRFRFHSYVPRVWNGSVRCNERGDFSPTYYIASRIVVFTREELLAEAGNASDLGKLLIAHARITLDRSRAEKFRLHKVWHHNRSLRRGRDRRSLL